MSKPKPARRTDVELCKLTVEVPCAQAFAEQFQTMPLGFYAACRSPMPKHIFCVNLAFLIASC